MQLESRHRTDQCADPTATILSEWRPLYTGNTMRGAPARLERYRIRERAASLQAASRLKTAARSRRVPDARTGLSRTQKNDGQNDDRQAAARIYRRVHPNCCAKAAARRRYRSRLAGVRL